MHMHVQRASKFVVFCLSWAGLHIDVVFAITVMPATSVSGCFARLAPGWRVGCLVAGSGHILAEQGRLWSTLRPGCMTAATSRCGRNLRGHNH